MNKPITKKNLRDQLSNAKSVDIILTNIIIHLFLIKYTKKITQDFPMEKYQKNLKVLINYQNRNHLIFTDVSL